MRRAEALAGGMPRALVPAGIAIIGVTYGLARYAYGLFVPEFRGEFGLSGAAAGIIASGSYVAYLAGTLASSPICDRAGARRAVVLGGLAASAGMAAVAGAPGALALGAAVALAGSGSGLAWPALSDAIARLSPAGRLPRALALVNSGTSYAVALAGPVALAAGTSWRAAWLVFALVGLGATAWVAAALPRGALAERSSLPALRLGWLLHSESAALFLLVLGFGIATAVYWAFAVDLVAEHRPGSGDDLGRLFLVLVGVSGIAGGAAGDVSARLGLRRTLGGAVALVAVAMAALALQPGSAAVALASGALFGSAFIVVAAGAALWTVATFAERPAAGMAAMTLVFTVGSVAGPPLAGLVADAAGLERAFELAALLTAGVVGFAVRAPAD